MSSSTSKPPFKQNKKKEIKAPNYKAIAASIDRVKEISYNEHDRKDYLTGFHRRKQARREYAQKKTEEKEKREKAEQKKFVKLQREAFQQSIIDSRKKHESEFGIKDEDEDDDEEEIKEEETIDEKGNIVKVLIKPSKIEETQIKEYSSEDKIITTTVKPLSFNSDGEEEESDNFDDNSDDDNDDNNSEEEEEEEEEESDKTKVKKKLPNNKKEFTSKFSNKKDTITADGLKLIDAENKIYQDEKGRRIKMRKEKGKIIPVVLTAAAETAIEKGWKLPRSLRTSQKKSWSHAVQKKSKKKQRKEKKGK
ncbi:hypothetical protein RB653_005648 [Dictyostelium firmibasis]|uniref:Ribosomal RNA-processing protein 17 n=1 Tax=Dictyostelium firmibasis TaxID=79012 RepID=A0AAN7YYD1_9MYCE